MDEERRACRASCPTWVRRPGDPDDEDARDAAYWASLTVAERVNLVWELSQEQWSMLPEPAHEPGLSRHITHVIRR